MIFKIAFLDELSYLIDEERKRRKKGMEAIKKLLLGK